MRTRTQFELIRALRRRADNQRGLAQGFTLVELMIVVAVVGLLAAVALPNFLQARAAAAGGAAIGESIGLAKECAVYAASGGIGAQPANCSTAGGTFSKSWSDIGTVDGLRCLNVTSSSAIDTVTVTVAANGSLGCSLT